MKNNQESENTKTDDIGSTYREIPPIGYALIREAEEHGIRKELPLTTQLFPYVWAASRTMSSRAISNWLKENQGVELSAVSIARALKRPGLHWNRIAQFARRWAVIIAPTLDMDWLAYLEQGTAHEGQGENEVAWGDIQIQQGMASGEISPFESPTIYCAARDLREHFFCMPKEAIGICMRILHEDYAMEEQNQGDEDNED